jgi:hypothetical protein
VVVVPMDVVALVVVSGGIEVEVVVVRVDVVIRVREVMRVVVLVGDCPCLTEVVVLEEVVVLLVLCAAT